MDIPNISAQEWVLSEEEYLKMILDQDIWEKVPLINSNELHNFKHGTLVRFRGMIQDMYGPEFYLNKFEVVNEVTNTRTFRNGKYCDGAVLGREEKVDIESSVVAPSERHSFVAMSIPGLNDWVKQYEMEKYRIPTEEPNKSHNKRSYNDVMDVDDTVENVKDVSPSKKVSSEDQSKVEHRKAPTVSREHILNHPLGEETARVCHLRVYKEFEALKLNDVCEFVGFLSANPSTEALLRDDDFDNEMEAQSHNPPSSLVPRIHVVHFKSMQHSNPLVGSLESENINYLKNIKKELLIVLTQLLLGDTLAAEYLICHLISEVYLRRDFMAIGKFSVNISHIPKMDNIDYVAEVYKFLEMLVTKSHYLPLTLENMNTLTFTPKKDYECNRLTSGILQLSKNTLLVLDETKLQEGKLDSAGVQSFKTLADAIKNQKISYDFNYYPIDFECDIKFLTFSEGKSMLPSDVQVPLRPEESCLNTFSEILKAARHFLKPKLLDSIRKYLTITQLIKYELTDEVQNMIEQEFVDMRQTCSSVTAEDLHSLLVLARLICLSEGKSSLDAGCWKKACEMEQQRKARISK